MSRGNDITTNRKARRDYTILDTFEAGIALKGTEVKSVRAGHINLADAFARVDKGDIWLHGCDIRPYERASHVQHEARAPRQLLLHRKEIQKIYSQTAEKGLTLVALRAYWKGQRVKIELGLGKGKVKGDHREDLKKRVQTREADRAVANFNRR